MSNKWLTEPKLVDTNQNSKMVMSFTDVNRLYLWLIKPPATSLIFGDYTKWCSSLMFYPFPVQYYGVNLYGANYLLRVNGQERPDTETGGCTCCGYLGQYPKYGYTLGEYKVPKFTSFLDYEPYSKYQLWLPYYGYIDLKSQYIEDKYLEIRLYVDFNTGKAQYVVGVNEQSVNIPYPPYLINADDSGTRIIGTYNFQIGYEVPLGASGMADMLRNMTVAAIGGALQIASSFVGGDTVETTNVEERNVRVTGRNPLTNRQITRATVSNKTTSTTTTDYSSFKSKRIAGAAAQTATQILSNMHLTPATERLENSIINSATCQNVVFIHRKPIIVTDIYSAEYRHLNGSPLCAITSLANITGYTELADIHLTGEGFAQITDREKAMLDSELSNGIIL